MCDRVKSPRMPGPNVSQQNPALWKIISDTLLLLSVVLMLWLVCHDNAHVHTPNGNCTLGKVWIVSGTICHHTKAVIVMNNNENITRDKENLLLHFPTGGGNRWGSRGAERRPRQRGRLPQRDRGSSSAQLLMPCYPRVIHHGSLRVRYVLPPLRVQPTSFRSQHSSLSPVDVQCW